jgi:DNA-binding transcriptional LysR family regulator
MDWNNLRFFFEFVRAGSLSGAAKRLGVDHSTVSRRIETLEEELGLRLIDRLPRAHHLTVTGAQLFDLAESVGTGITAIERFARGADLSPQGIVRISAPPALASHFLALRLLPLRLEYPGLSIELIGEIRRVSLSKRDADLAFRMFRPREKGLIARKLATIGYGLYGARDYLARQTERSWDYLGYDEGLDHVPQQRWLKTIIGDRPLALRTNDLTTLLTAVRAGLGVSMLPHFLVQGDPNLKAVATTAPPTRELWLLFHRDIGRSPRVRAVIDHVAAVFAEARTIFEG